MALFSKLFGGRGQQATAGAANSRAEKQYAPGTQLAYDDQLIKRFTGHHRTLLTQFNGIVQAGEGRRYDELAQALKQFLSVLEQHILEENLRLYIYLEKCISDEDHKQMIREMKQEMGRIGQSVRLFVRHHLQFGINDQNIGKFRHELKDIGAALVDRIRREEDGLYTLYLPPSNYQLL